MSTLFAPAGAVSFRVYSHCARWLILVFALGVARPASAAPGAVLSWMAAQPSAAGAVSGLGSIKTDSAGNVFLTSAFSRQLSKFNASGSSAWNLDISASVGAHWGRLAVDAANNVYVCGIGNAARSTLVVQKVSTNGASLWTHSYDIGAVSEHMSGGAMAIAPNGNLYLLGRAGNSSQTTAPVTILRINTTTGAEINRRALGSTRDLSTAMTNTALAVDSSNNVFVGLPEKFIRLSTDLQSQTWSVNISARAIATAGGNVYVTGNVATGLSFAMFVARVNLANGSILWNATRRTQPKAVAYSTYDVAGGAMANYSTYGGNSIIVDGAGNVYAAGEAADTTSFTGGFLARYVPSTGQITWSSQIGISGVDSSCFDMASDAQNNVYVACTDMQQQNGSSTAVASVFGSTGTQKLYLPDDGPGGQDDLFDHVVLGASGGVYLLDESSFSDGSIQPTIFKYTVSGL